MNSGHTNLGVHRVARTRAVTLAILVATSFNSIVYGETQSEPFTFKPDSAKGHILTAQAFVDREAIAPGDVFNILISLKMEKDWHVYWSNPGETGKPTAIDWKLPAGFEVGRTSYPPPQASYMKELDETSYLLGDHPLLLTAIKPPANLKPGERVTLQADVSWLACKTTCIPGRAKLSLSVPVVAVGTTPKFANEKLFKEARDALPTPADKAPHIKFSARIEPAVAAPGSKLTAVLNVDIASRMHMQSHAPNQDFLIPAYVFVEPTPGFELGDVEYPKAHEREDKFLGKLSEYAGSVAFRIPIEVEKDAGASPRRIRGVFQYQICADNGTCFPPEKVAFEIPVQMEGGPAPSASEWTAAATIAPTDSTADVAAATENSDKTGAASAPPQTTNGESGGPDALTRLQNWLLEFGYAGALALAFIGGLILNLMPCVLPVLSLKILSFVRQAHEDRGRIFLLGLTYSAGIMTFFGVLAALFAWTGTGWGQLFQNPVFVIIVAGVVTAFAMSLFGVFTVFTPRVVTSLDEKVQGEGFTSAYATGVLATLLGTACTAPFLTAAIGAATKITISHGPGYAAMIFITAGFGMATPFLVFAAQPALMRYIPKPGNWMHTFEALMGFLLLMTVIWLLNPLRGQIGDFGVLISLFFLLMVSMAAWVKGKIAWGDPIRRKAALYAVAIAMIAIGWYVPFGYLASIDQLVTERIERNELTADGRQWRAIQKAGGIGPIDDSARVETELLINRLEDLISEQTQTQSDISAVCDMLTPLESLIARLNAANSGTLTPPKEPDWTNGIPWYHYRRDEALADVRAGYTVFVDYTADWCVNCKVNLKTSIQNEAVVSLMQEYNVIPYEADYTLPVPEIKRDLLRFGRAGVPMYLVYSPGKPDQPQILPELLTPGLLIDALKSAGPSRVGAVASAARSQD